MIFFWRRKEKPVTATRRSVRVVKYDQHGNPLRVENREGVRAVKRHVLDIMNALARLRRFFEQDLNQLMRGLEGVERIHQPNLLQELKMLKEKTDHTYNLVLKAFQETHQPLDDAIIQSIKRMAEYTSDVRRLMRQIEQRLKTIAAKQHQEEGRIRDLENHLENLKQFIIQHERELDVTSLIQTLRELDKIIEKIKAFLRNEGSVYYRETREMLVKAWDRLEKTLHTVEKTPTAENVKYLVDALRLFKREVDLTLEDLMKKEALGIRLEKELQLKEKDTLQKIGEAQAFARGLQKSA